MNISICILAIGLVLVIAYLKAGKNRKGGDGVKSKNDTKIK